MAVGGSVERVRLAARTAGDHLGTATAALAHWRDPREQLLRRRRAARAATAGLGGFAGLLGTGSVALAIGQASVVPLAGGGLAALVLVPTAVVGLRWRRLAGTPLPDPALVPVRRPGRDSAAYPALGRLTLAERSLAELLDLLGRDPAVPSGEIEQARAAARVAAAALRREAADLAVLERARDSSPAAGAELVGVVSSALARLEAGVGAHDGLVASAARAVSSLSGPGRGAQDLTAAVDRVDALTAALVELADLHASHPTRK